MLAVKHASLYQCNQGIMAKIFQLRVQMLDSHDNDAPWRWMIATMVQHEGGVFHVQMKWRI